jgi:hypothetical protein
MSERSTGSGTPPGERREQAPDPGQRPPRDQPAPPGRRRRLALPLLVLAIVGVGAFLLTGGGDALVRRQLPAAEREPSEPFVTFRDPESGFSVRHPKSWERLTSPDPAVRLVVSNGQLDSLLVRFARFQDPVTRENVGDIKAFTDAVVSGGKVTVVEQQAVTINGLLGYYYLYRFKDEDRGTEGVHAHYFLFQGRKMHSLVFQALPAEDFAGLSATFDEMAGSFRSDPDTVEPTSTTTPA